MFLSGSTESDGYDIDSSLYYNDVCTSVISVE